MADEYDKIENKDMLEACSIINDLCTTVCRLCKQVNPQHKDCKSCPEMDSYCVFISKVHDTVQKNIAYWEKQGVTNE